MSNATCNHWNHSMSDLAGYEVVQTQAAGEWLTLPGRTAHVFEGATTYVNALDAARALRVPGSWAVIYPVYTCGGRSRSPY